MLTSIADTIDMHYTERPARAHAEIYHFLELALAHPGEDGHEYFAAPETEAGLVATFADLSTSEILVEALIACRQFLAESRRTGFEEIEAAHIALFSANFPVVPCPPYGSLFTVEEAKRLEEMLAIKQFYREIGIEIAPTFDDLPDHLCVELEVMHLLSFRESEATSLAIVEGLHAQQRFFLDRFMQPFVDRLADIACRHQGGNPYSYLLNATRLLLAHHREELGGASPANERHVP